MTPEQAIETLRRANLRGDVREAVRVLADALAERDGISAQLDESLREHHEALNQRDAAERERDAAVAERDQLRSIFRDIAPAMAQVAEWLQSPEVPVDDVLVTLEMIIEKCVALDSVAPAKEPQG